MCEREKDMDRNKKYIKIVSPTSTKMSYVENKFL